MILANALSRLPDDYREVLILRHLEGLSFPEVSQRMDRTLEAVLEARTDTISAATADQLRAFKDIVCMRPQDLEISLPQTAPPNWQAAAERLHQLGAHNSAERVAARQ